MNGLLSRTVNPRCVSSVLSVQDLSFIDVISFSLAATTRAVAPTNAAEMCFQCFIVRSVL